MQYEKEEVLLERTKSETKYLRRMSELHSYPMHTYDKV